MHPKEHARREALRQENPGLLPERSTASGARQTMRDHNRGGVVVVKGHTFGERGQSRAMRRAIARTR